MEATRGRNSAVRSNCGHNRQCVRACVAVGAVFAGVEELALKTKTSLDWVAIESTTTTWGGHAKGTRASDGATRGSSACCHSVGGQGHPRHDSGVAWLAPGAGTRPDSTRLPGVRLGGLGVKARGHTPCACWRFLLCY
jgi:hypothetical protein